jgi:hypothetical protein
VTENDLEILRLKVRIEALQLLIRTLYSGLANTSPTAAQTCREQFARLRQDHGKMALTGTTPEVSDLIAAEYQEALDDLLTFIESGFRG